MSFASAVQDAPRGIGWSGDQPSAIRRSDGQRTARPQPNPINRIVGGGPRKRMPFFRKRCTSEGGGGVGTRPRYLIVCLWRRPLASRHRPF